MGKIIEDFVSVRSVITLGAFLTVYGLVWFGRPVPDIIIRIVDLMLAFWFGEKVGKASVKKEDK